MSENISINEVKIGMILADKKDNKFVVIDRNLNGDDDYYSSLAVISEEEYIKHKGNHVTKSDLKTFTWIEMTEYHKDFSNCGGLYNVSSEKVFSF